MFWLALIVIAGYVAYVMRPEERTRVIAIARRIVEAAWDEYCRRRNPPDAFRDALTARTRAPFLTAGVVLLNLLIFALMLVGDGRMGDPDTLVHWGASAGPVTTNGQWWRLLTATFVHTGFLQLVLEMAALAQVGLLVERMVGHAAFAGLYLTSAAFAAAIGLWVDPLPATAGASGAIFGMYGLLVALVIRGTLRRSRVTIPVPVVARLAPVAAMFILYSWSAGGPQWTSGPATFVIEFAIGLALTRTVADRKPPALRVAGLAATVLAIAGVIAAPLSGTIDVRSEISRLIAVEDRTTVTYQTATERFKRGTIDREALARVIELIVVPELEAARSRLLAIAGVPRQQQPLVEDADEFLQLRRESWLLRAHALHESSMRLLRDADEMERASLDALKKIRSIP
jgi:membrane associated rhomboid family serine protease